MQELITTMNRDARILIKSSALGGPEAQRPCEGQIEAV
jgi:hypothetical protein